MKEVVYEPADEMIAWARERIDGAGFRDDARAIGLREDGAWRGVVVYDNFTTTGCWISVASDASRRWLTREFIVRSMIYPFVQLGYPRINACVSCKNAASLAFCDGFGWTQEGVMREAGSEGEDLIIFGLLRRECRWLPGRLTGKVSRHRL
ncbi:GNAT family N-acetyltransferase [Shinella pollutisoli]|uniref:GNAT family N-acetyltransferase n=1 Tax=Shinella pollutisoli TaxID=2250594 RepID=A0ABV7DIZ1_9HYPH|nr:GNAT family protein [Shinella pollutisoli]